ncbi:alkaline phosphatase D family protein [Rhizobium mongolense]|uniref:Alkaline phosphatase D n=2 Tax=Rhizobium mongolense TaxID=57676 RepID=A0ABR6ISN4_9HYPH|nr:alkaline phosphatase D family protein [Rhizobium mongolense]MBB4230918.1 alkaline phosphatase D [Rhizobium mongolense]TVZ66076.1 alkaline phosphatase D [Rhizobium mongolense USDA 1844]
MKLTDTTRRRFLSSIGAVGGFAAASLVMPYYARGSSSRPIFTSGVQSGDVDATSGMIWTRVDRPSRLFVEYSTSDKFLNAVRLAPIDVTPETDLAGKLLLRDLPPDHDIFYRFMAADLQDINSVSQRIHGQFRTAPSNRRTIRFAWSGDTAGQGWGIDDEGMRTYQTIAYHRPDFMIHSGDTIYADNPMPDEIRLRDGGLWKNRIVTEEKRDIAQTLDQFRGQWKYNLLDEHVKELNAVCPVIYQWDDHEVLNNWSPSTDLRGNERYKEKSVSTLATRASRAFHEMTPIRYIAAEPGRVYRKVSYGPLLDIFFVDLRSYRGPNDHGLDPVLSATSRILGEGQVAWLKRELVRSTATWKVIACDMPVGLVIWDDYGKRQGSESFSNGDNGAPLGRELEFADLLRFIRDAAISNIVWLTADVHYTAAHYYNPAKAKFPEFLPFWEFVSGPLHSGTYGAQELDMTFGPDVRFIKAAPGGADSNLPPSAGLQFFGLVEIDGQTEQMTVRLMDRNDTELWRTVIDPQHVS